MGQVRVGRAVTLYRHPQKVDIEAEEWKTKDQTLGNTIAKDMEKKRKYRRRVWIIWERHLGSLQ